MKKNFLLFLTVIGAGMPLLGQNVMEGQRLYELKCGRCHYVYSPQRFSPEEWKTIVKDMGPQSGLNAEAEKIILEYLKAASGKKESGIPTSPVLSGYLYTEFFSGPAVTDTFDLHYLNFNITGRLHEKVTYRAEFEMEHGGGEEEPPFVEQAYLDVRLFPGAAVRIGAILTPFNRFDEFHGPIENFIVTRPQMSREIGVSAWKEVGIDIHGSVPVTSNLYLTYDIYAINGLGDGSRLRSSRQYRDNNNDKSIGFRLAGIVSDRWEIGGSYYRGAWDDEGTYLLQLYGAHFLGKIGNLSLHSEYARALSDNPQPEARGKADGYFMQVSYLLDKSFRPTIRYGTLDYLDNGNALGRSPRDQDLKVLALGMNYYLSGSIVFKFEYDFYIEGKRKEDIENNLLALQAAVRF